MYGISANTYILWYDPTNDTSLGNPLDTGALNNDWSGNYWNVKPENIVNQGARSYYGGTGEYIKWKPSPGQAGTYYIRSTNMSCVHTITVVASATSNQIIKNFGATNALSLIHI